MRGMLLVLCVVTALACDESQTGPTVALDREFELAPGGSAVIDEASLTVRFNNVSSDSRCPGDVVCVQAGNAVVRIAVISGGQTREYELHTTPSRQSVRDGEVTITLVELQPYPFTSRPPILPEDYRATLKATR